MMMKKWKFISNNNNNKRSRRPFLVYQFGMIMHCVENYYYYETTSRWEWNNPPCMYLSSPPQHRIMIEILTKGVSPLETAIYVTHNFFLSLHWDLLFALCKVFSNRTKVSQIYSRASSPFILLLFYNWMNINV